MIDVKWQEIERTVIDQCHVLRGKLRMDDLIHAVGALPVRDAQYLCGCYGMEDVTIFDGIVAIAAKIAIRYETRAAYQGGMKALNKGE